MWSWVFMESWVLIGSWILLRSWVLSGFWVLLFWYAVFTVSQQKLWTNFLPVLILPSDIIEKLEAILKSSWSQRYTWKIYKCETFPPATLVFSSLRYRSSIWFIALTFSMERFWKKGQIRKIFSNKIFWWNIFIVSH